MAVTTKVFQNNNPLHSTNDVRLISNAMPEILTMYDWYDGSTATVNGGKLYVDEGTYIEFSMTFDHDDGFRIVTTFVTPKATKTITQILDNNYHFSFAIGVTPKGIMLAVNLTATANIPLAFNIYIGEFMNPDGTIKKGFIYVNSDSTLETICDAASTEPALGTTISADRKAVLVPVANTVTGDVFNDIFIMRYSPIQYGTMEIEGKGVYLCGKTLCLKDNEEV